MLIKPLDFGIFVPALAAVIVSFFFAYSGANNQSLINLKGENGEWVFPLETDETVAVSGPLGNTVVEIQNGAVRFVSSPCANQSCVAAGALHSQGQWAACLPNKVMLYIAGDSAADKKNGRNAGDVDAATW